MGELPDRSPRNLFRLVAAGERLCGWPNALRATALALAALGASAAAQEVDVIVCKGCHGMAGEGRAAAGYPPLAGQPRLYLLRQLEAFADGRRDSHVMGPVARWLTPQQRERFARHFSERTPPVLSASPARGSERGRALAQVGDAARRVQACGDCHGPSGRGQAPSSPYLAGLDEQYLVGELEAWKSGRRRTEPGAAMAHHLATEDILAVAAHYAGLSR